MPQWVDEPERPGDTDNENDETGGQFGVPITQQTAPDYEPPAPKVVEPMGGGGVREEPISSNPVLAARGVRTAGPMADQAAQNAEDYRAKQSDYVSATGQMRPQQYGVSEDYKEEGPLSPEETAAAMPQNAADMDKLIRQHSLPAMPQAKREGYENYVQSERIKRDAEKARLRDQAALNRGEMAARSAQTMQQLSDYNAVQGAGPAAGGYAGNGPTVTQIGPYHFVGGSWRPQTPEEAAKTDLTRAQAEYMRSRPMIAEGGNETKRYVADTAAGAKMRNTDVNASTRIKIQNMKDTGQWGRLDYKTQAKMEADAAAEEGRNTRDTLNRQSRENIAGANRESRETIAGNNLEATQVYREQSLQRRRAADEALENWRNSKDQAARDKFAENVKRMHDQAWQELQARRQQAERDAGIGERVKGWFSGGKNEAAIAERRDRPFDARGKPGRAVPDSYKGVEDEFAHYADLLDRMDYPFEASKEQKEWIAERNKRLQQ